MDSACVERVSRVQQELRLGSHVVEGDEDDRDAAP